MSNQNDTTPFDKNEETAIEIVCPECNTVGSMVSIEKVWQQFPVYLTPDGELDFEGVVLKQTPGDSDENGLQCTECEAWYERSEILESEQVKQILKNLE